MRTCMSLIVVVLLCTFSGCSQMNTCIGWPWTYWEHGLLPVVGVLAIYGLMPVFLGLVISIGDDYEFALFGIVVVLIVAGLVLQLLPPSTSGIQFVPLPPWYYVSWIARIVSVACWIFITLAGLCFFAAKREERNVAGFLLFFALSINALLSFATPTGVTTPDIVQSSPPQVAPSVPDHPPPQNQSCQDRIAQWESRRQEQAQALTKLLSDKERLVARIKSLGAKSKKELMEHRVGHILVEELGELSRQIAAVQNELVTLDTVTEQAQSKLRSLEREALLRGTKATEEQYRQMNGTVHVLEEELRRRTGEKTPGSEVRTDKLLDDVFTGSRP